MQLCTFLTLQILLHMRCVIFLVLHRSCGFCRCPLSSLLSWLWRAVFGYGWWAGVVGSGVLTCMSQCSATPTPHNPPRSVHRCASHQFSRHAKQIPLSALTLDPSALNFLRGAISCKSKSCVPAAEKKAQQAVPLSSQEEAPGDTLRSHWDLTSCSHNIRQKTASGLRYTSFSMLSCAQLSVQAFQSIFLWPWVWMDTSCEPFFQV